LSVVISPCRNGEVYETRESGPGPGGPVCWQESCHRQSEYFFFYQHQPMQAIVFLPFLLDITGFCN